MRLINATAKSKLSSAKGSFAALARRYPMLGGAATSASVAWRTKGLGDVYAYHPGAAFGDEACVVPLAASHVDAGEAIYLW
jgi:hypothetical protein